MKVVYVLNMISRYYDGDDFTIFEVSSHVNVCDTYKLAKAKMEKSIEEELVCGYTKDMLYRNGPDFAEFCDKINGELRRLYSLEITRQKIETKVKEGSHV